MADSARTKQDDLQPQQQQAMQGAQGASADLPGAARRGAYKKDQATQYSGSPAIEAAGAPPAAPAAQAGQEVDLQAMLEALKQRQEATLAELDAVNAELAEDRETIAFIQSKIENPGSITQEDIQRLQPLGLEADTPRQLLQQGVDSLNEEVVASEELLPQYDADLQSIAEERVQLEAQIAAQQGA